MYIIIHYVYNVMNPLKYEVVKLYQRVSVEEKKKDWDPPRSNINFLGSHIIDQESW